jgi:hypothetical protein
VSEIQYHDIAIIHEFWGQENARRDATLRRERGGKARSGRIGSHLGADAVNESRDSLSGKSN